MNLLAEVQGSGVVSNLWNVLDACHGNLNRAIQNNKPNRKCQISNKRELGKRQGGDKRAYLKMVMSQSQECEGKAMKKQIAANPQTRITRPVANLDTFCCPR